MAGPLDGYTPSAGGPLAGYTPGAPKPSPGASGNSWGSWLTSPTFANESLLNEAKDVGLSGADYATLGAVKKLAPTSWGVEQAHNNLGLADYGLGAAAYALGPGKILAPLAASAKLGALGSAALEGAMAGGASGAIANPTDPWGVATGAAAGGALGGAAGGLGKVAGTVAGRFAPAVDPAAAVATTKAARDAAYAPLKDIHFDPNDVMAAHSSTTLTPGMAADVSPWMEQTIAKQQQFIQDGGASANDVADYAKNLRKMANAPGASNGDQILGNQIADSLTGNPDRQIPGLLGGAQPTSGHPVGLAARQLDVANAAHQNYAMAQNLQQWQQQLNDAKISPGAEPWQQAQYYPQGSQQYKTLVDLYKAGSDSSGGLSYPLAHIAGEGLEMAGAAAGASGPVVAGLGAAGHLAKIPIKGLMNLYKRANLKTSCRGLIPSLTGVQAPSTMSPWGPNAPSAGDLIKALAISQGSQAGF